MQTHTTEVWLPLAPLVKILSRERFINLFLLQTEIYLRWLLVIACEQLIVGEVH